MPFKIVRNDITKMNTEAIVNTANDHPTVGTGCDSAVYKAAGYDELLKYREEKIGFVPEGDAFITPGFKLKAKYIIHAVSPLYMGGDKGEEEKLRSCYRKSLQIAKENGIKSISFPLISTGGFGYPKEEGMRIAVDEINAFLLSNGAEVLILGAFGCGAFCNPPVVVAKAFKDVQKKYNSYFETIEYAVFCGGHETENYDAFCEVFGTDKIYDLSRFLEAHEKDYERALKEVKAGYKRTHWMWYIFPQIAGLGFSRTSQFYSISDLGEAKAYLQDAVLGAHMRELCEALLALETNDAAEVFDWPDDMKLKSCMTLFELADPGQKMYGDVLDKFFAGERDEKTVEIVNSKL